MQKRLAVSLAGLLLVGLMHVALLAVMLQREPATTNAVQSQRPPPDAGRRNAIQWLLPPSLPPQAPAPVARAQPQPKASRGADVAETDRQSALPRPAQHQPSEGNPPIFRAR